MSLTSVLLPLPLTPAMQMKRPQRELDVDIAQLLARAPRTTSFFALRTAINGSGMLRSPRRTVR